jgi:hypothetical protein
MVKKRLANPRVTHQTICVEARQAAFLAAYGRLGSIFRASRVCHMGLDRHREWLRQAPYKKAFDAAKDEAAEYLIGEAVEQATKGRKSAILLMFLIKALRPEYRERYGADIRFRATGDQAVGETTSAAIAALDAAERAYQEGLDRDAPPKELTN